MNPITKLPNPVAKFTLIANNMLEFTLKIKKNKNKNMQNAILNLDFFFFF